MSDNSKLIDQFVEMTKTTEDVARSYLESRGWDLMMAANGFFSGEAADLHSVGEQPGQLQQPSEAFTPRSNVSSGSATPPKRKAVAAGSSKIRTLSDINSAGQNNDSDDDEHENLYAGGEKSGMAVQGPNKRGGASGSNDDSLVDRILKKAAEGGAAPEEQTPQKKSNSYTGSGYRLGSEDDPSSLTQPATSASTSVEGDEDEDIEPATRHLTFWRNGFSVDDGPLYSLTDPANQEMLTAINNGRAPLSLLNVRRGQHVEVRVVKRTGEDYTPPPKAPPKPFEGTGNRLGSPAVYIAPSPAPGTFPGSSNSNAAAPTVDESQPTTNIQIRLGDGSKIVAKLNHTHTIADIRQYIESTNPAPRPYILQTTFPVKELQDSNQTVQEAGLLNSVIVQRYQ